MEKSFVRKLWGCRVKGQFQLCSKRKAPSKAAWKIPADGRTGSHKSLMKVTFKRKMCGPMLPHKSVRVCAETLELSCEGLIPTMFQKKSTIESGMKNTCRWVNWFSNCWARRVDSNGECAAQHGKVIHRLWRKKQTL